MSVQQGDCSQVDWLAATWMGVTSTCMDGGDQHLGVTEPGGDTGPAGHVPYRTLALLHVHRLPQDQAWPGSSWRCAARAARAWRGDVAPPRWQ